MNRIVSVFVAGLMICTFVACLDKEGLAFSATSEKSLQNEPHGLALSDMQVKITSLGHTATFRLYDTVAARKFFDQLPLGLDLTNFRDAQWRDVVMFYGDFGSAAGLHELGHAISGSEYVKGMSGTIQIEKGEVR